MEDNLGFEGVLRETLERKRDALDSRELPQLKEQFRVFQSAFQGLFQLLLRKGLIHDDPYRHDLKISEVSNPPEGSFIESEKIDQMSIRLAGYDAQLDFLTNYYQFSVEFLNLRRIKLLISLVRYFNWQQMSANAPGLNTRCLAELLDSVKKGNDALSVGLVNDGLNQMEKTSKTITALLREITFYHKECYKLDVRTQVMPQVMLNPAEVFTAMEDTLRQIKRAFSIQLGDWPFYPDLIQEILNENYAGNAEALRQELLKKLDVRVEKKADTAKEVSFKNILMDGVRILATSGILLDDAIRKLQENSAILHSKHETLWTRFRDWISGMLQTAGKAVSYEVEYFDPVASVNKRETIDFTLFCDEVTKRARILSSVGIKNSQTYRRLESAKDDQVFAFLSKNFEEMQVIQRRLTALDTYFKNEIPDEDKDKIRGIRVELLGIKDTMIKVNQKKHEYVSQRDELEQMKKLGIRTDIS